MIVTATGRGPGLLLLQEIFGVSGYIRRRGADLVAAGHVVLAPELYWRLDATPIDESAPGAIEDAMGRSRRLDGLRTLQDAVAALVHLRTLPEVDGGTGVIGFCFGGGLAFNVAAVAEVDALVSYYGSTLPGLLDLAPQVTAPSLHHFGTADAFLDADTVGGWPGSAPWPSSTANCRPAEPLEPVPDFVGGGGQDVGMTITGRLELVALDAPDIERLAAFYAELAGWETVREEEDWITVRAGDGHEVAFQSAPDHVPPQWPGQEHPQQFHLDFLVDGYEAAAERAVALGARRLADGDTWITLADPAGHPFDLCQRDGVGPTATLSTVTIDAPDTSGLARFYADLLGMEVTYDGEEGAMIAGDGRSLMFQKIGEYTAPSWPDPSRPQQAHLDILVDDLDAGQARALELGATLLDGAQQGFRVFADPAGHPFCLTD